MNRYLCLLAAALYLCLQWQVNAGECCLSHLRRILKNDTVIPNDCIDTSDLSTQHRSIDRVRRNAASPSDVLRLLKQPAGPTRTAVPAADYMDVAVKLLKRSLNRRPKRSINATDLEVVADLTGCSPRHRVPSCTHNSPFKQFRTAASTCNNGDNNDRCINHFHQVIQLSTILSQVREVSNQDSAATANLDCDDDPLYTHMVTIFSCELNANCFLSSKQIPKKDPRFGKKSEECIPFFRSAAGCGSPFIDAGQVYGSDVPKLASSTLDNAGELLPFTNMGANMCRRCPLSGCRTNENIGLTSLHTLLMREHNRLAQRLYQELHEEHKSCNYNCVLTFRDYLLHIVGPDFIRQALFHLSWFYDETWTPASPMCSPQACLRFAHLMVQPFMFPFFAPWRIVLKVWPRALILCGVDPILRGLVAVRPSLTAEISMNEDELRDRLFKFSAELALDLGALNMQRGRDHGLPGYNKWRKFCGLSQPRNLAQLAKVMNNTDLAKNLLDLYGTPDNIDVWLGGVAEPFVRGGRVGPLFACLIATQFQRIRQGDRLWWENEGVFTEAQRESLRETSLARIMCDNTGITEVPDRPFQYRPRGSGYTQCEDIPTFDLSPWREGELCSKSLLSYPRITCFRRSLEYIYFF
uniref:Eosinophil peroxidase n=1 Tax=Seriola dumerili TaxID=41447 RepID=A0A3B4V783_SERDU